jgi:tetratricopeptide (TPR) repeat protein
VSRDRIQRAGPWLLAGLGLAVGGLAAVQALAGREASSTEGNRNYAGALAAILLAPAVAVASAQGSAGRRVFAGTAAASLVAALAISESRGGALAAFAGVALLLRQRTSVARMAALAALAALAAVPFLASRNPLSAERRETVSVRMGLWAGALRLAAEHPWRGVGAGNFAAAFPPFRNEREFRLSLKFVGGDFVEAGDPHSSWLHVAAEGGFPALLALLAAAALAGRAFVRGGGEPWTAGLAGGAAAYLVAGCFNTLTNHLSHTVLFWGFIGMQRRLAAPEAERPAGPGTLALLAAGTAAGLFAVWSAGSLAVREAAIESGRAAKDPVRLRAAAEQGPPGWRAWYELGKALDARGLFAESAPAYRKALEFRPRQLDALHRLAAALVRSGAPDGEAEDALRRAAETAPYDRRTWSNWGQLEAGRGRWEAAREKLGRAAGLDPSHAPTRYALGVVLLALGDPPAALGELRAAKALGQDVAGRLRQDRPASASEPALAELFR